MTSPLLALFPRRWRDRYGAEVAEMLATSTTPHRDRLDLVRTAATVHIDRLRKKTAMRRAILLSSFLLIVVGILTTSRAAAQTRFGLTEVPMHWWGALALTPLLLGAVGVLIVVLTRRRRTLT